MIRLKRDYILNTLFLFITAIGAFLIFVILLGIIVVLFEESFPAIKRFGFLGFVLSPSWDPVKELFGGAIPLLGTLITSLLALFLAVPIALGIAIFITEVAPRRLKEPIGVAIELLAAIPSIIYGMWGLFTLAPINAKYIEPFLQMTLGQIPPFVKLFSGTPLGIDLFTASLILSIMIIPFTASVARDSFQLVPAVLKESAYGLGATKWEVIKDVVFPYCKLGVLGGIGLSLGRALGETMAVAFVLGNLNQFPSSLFSATATVTVKLANEFTEADKDIHLASLFYLALLLFILSFTILAIAKYFIQRTQYK
ncbi:MAG: phosphate ABC transporter permease subunit PstC [Caldimicrobium sp.]|nr:phosphate ABC transporter permease subunit PstC [Caldimicrobium sp.]MCX7613087.1 phosphate ABC transporter permease subunit PstC [Caldimicrobium sp.]MDW8182669.1 phosphate ABC transporter permease subunit PstC [Caldimicrobium sp.]